MKKTNPKNLLEVTRRRDLFCAIETVRQTPNLIESYGYTLEDFDKKIQELRSDYDRFWQAKVCAEASPDPVLQNGQEVLLKDTQEHQAIKELIRNTEIRLWIYLCEFIDFQGWEGQVNA